MAEQLLQTHRRTLTHYCKTNASSDKSVPCTPVWTARC